MKWIWLVITTVLMFACDPKTDYQPDTYMDPIEQDKLLNSIIRYVGKLPPKAADSAKFDPRYDGYYQELVSKHRLTHYYVLENGEAFFMLRRPAPSLQKKFVAIGGRMKFNDADSLIEYEEVFRTWRLVPDTLARRSALLFDKMIKGESLEPFLTKNSPDEYIEFPDDRTFFDKTSRTWRLKE